MIIRGSKGRHLDLSSFKVMGVVNLTPDSFFEGSRLEDSSMLVERVGRMIDEGMDILDMGPMSSRPGATELSTQEEVDRLMPGLTAVRDAFPELWISVDTYRSDVLIEAMRVGIDIVNDISGAQIDIALMTTVAEFKLPYILMHMQGTPRDMQSHPSYTDVTLDIMKYFDRKIHELRRHGVGDIIIDPGFGFGKCLDHNYALLRHLASFRIFDLPILAGLSRKSMIYKPLNILPSEALNGTTALHMLALQNGANILRAHDVKEAAQCVALWCLYEGRS